MAIPVNPKTKADIVKEYLRKNEDVSSKKITKVLLSKYPGLWPSDDACYSMVRRYRGAHGRHNKKRTSEQFKVNVPKASRKKYKNITLRSPGRWCILSDLHVPYHHEKALEAAIKYAVDQKCDHLLLNGDALDAYQVSRWCRDPNLRSVDKEVKILSELLKEIEGYFPGEKVYKIGNHEDRIEQYLFMNAPGMLGISKWQLGRQLQQELDIPSWRMIESKQLYKLGKLNAFHGHELPRGITNPVNVARGLWLRTTQTSFTGHWHQTSEHVATNGAKSKTWVCFSVGCLCNLHPDYAPINNWNHGLAIVDITSSGNFSEDNKRIVDGQVW